MTPSPQPTPTQEYLLNAMRAASLRSQLMTQDLKTIAFALQHGMINVTRAVEWLKEVGADPLIGALPEAVRKATETSLAKAAIEARGERTT